MFVTCNSPVPKKFRLLLAAIMVASTIGACSRDPLSAGNDFFKKADYASAVIEFKNAVQGKPESLEARLALAEALERTSDIPGAEQHLRKALNTGGSPDQLYPRIALLMLDSKENARIINDFKEMRLSSADADSDLRAAVAVAFVSQDKIAQAKEQLQLAKVPTSSVLLANAQVALSEGKPEQAKSILDNQVVNDNTPWWILRGLGRIAEATDNRERAIDFMTQAHNTAPWHWGVTGEYGEFLVGIGKLDQAVGIRDNLIKVAPNYYWTHYLDALILSRQGKTEESMTAATKVLRAVPEHLPATLIVADAELKKGDVRMANMRLQKIVLHHPYSIPVLQLLGESQLRLEKPGEAAETVKRGLVVSASDPRLLSLKADLSIKRGDLKEAIAMLELLKRKNPDNPGYLLRLSELQLAIGHKDMARNQLIEAAALSQDKPAILNRIVATLLGMGEVQKAQELADSALKNRPSAPGSYLISAAVAGALRNNEGAWQALQKALDLQPAYQPALDVMRQLTSTPAQRELLMDRYGKAIEARNAGEQAFLAYGALIKAQTPNSDSLLPLYEKGIKALPESAAIREALLNELFKQGKSEAALKTAQTGASSNNASLDAIALLGRTYERSGDLRLATETFRKLANNYPLRTDLKMKLAELEAETGHKKEATTVLRSLITDRPFDPQPYIILAKMTAPINMREALSITHELGQTSANKLTALLLEGDLILQDGKTDEALKIFSEAGKAGAQPAASLRIVQILDRSNRSAAADQELNDTLRKHPKDPSVQGFAAQRLRTNGKHQEAIRILQQLVSNNPNNAALLNDLAWAQFEAGDKQALKNAEMASRLAPDQPVILDTLGMAQSANGQTQEATKTLRYAVNLAPAFVTAKLHLAELLASTSNTSEAGALIKSIELGKLSADNLAAYKRVQTKLK